MSTRARFAFLVAAAFAAATVAPAFAAPQAMAVQASTAAKHAAAQHGIFGTITAVQSPESAQFTMRSVDGTTVHVDASQAKSSGDYSGGLYVGKRVLVTGTTGANGVFQAVSLSRQSSLRGLHSY